ncbi:hypothetical protein O1611_g6549 [Lasiodiplodia mahajangana]|uniref:Uncharacterized protein n=1 Tax=Lasiodiplodia mahajangana TaxID=1108764 RepID=A0ACC2JHZ8_9PEZI|nr:hypothetical protein O1611_g6549 [Lasiodiplodia mahajangana]
MPGMICADSMQHIYKNGEESDGLAAEAGCSKAPRADKMSWDRFKDILYDLYMLQAKTLPEVMKTMLDQHNFERSYQLGEKWGWKKYNQAGVKPPPARINKSRRSSSPGKQRELPDASGVRERDSTPLQEQLSRVFADPWLDNRYYSAVQIYAILLRRYSETPSAPSRYKNWDNIAKSTIGFHPVGILLIMSSLIVTIATSEWRSDLNRTPLPSDFEIAKLGIDAASRWENTTLVAEFCEEFKDILKDDNTIRDAIQKYIAHNWPKIPANNFLEVEQVHLDEGWSAVAWHGATEDQALLPSEDINNFTGYQSNEMEQSISLVGYY